MNMRSSWWRLSWVGSLTNDGFSTSLCRDLGIQLRTYRAEIMMPQGWLRSKAFWSCSRVRLCWSCSEPSWPDAAQQRQHLWREGWQNEPNSFVTGSLSSANGNAAILNCVMFTLTSILLTSRCHSHNASVRDFAWVGVLRILVFVTLESGRALVRGGFARNNAWRS